MITIIIIIIIIQIIIIIIIIILVIIIIIVIIIIFCLKLLKVMGELKEYLLATNENPRFLLNISSALFWGLFNIGISDNNSKGNL